MARVLLALAVIAVALLVAWIVQRRRPDAPTRGSWAVPAQLDRADFVRPEAELLVAMFSSQTCDSCAAAWLKVDALTSDRTATQRIEAEDDPDLHKRYGIGAVPTIVVADRVGVVKGSFLGPPPAQDLWALVAEQD